MGWQLPNFTGQLCPTCFGLSVTWVFQTYASYLAELSASLIGPRSTDHRPLLYLGVDVIILTLKDCLE